MNYLVRVTPANRERLYKKYRIEGNKELVIRSVEDLFCQSCGSVLKPVWTKKRFRTKGKKIEMISFVARCLKEGVDYDCDCWREILWKRTGETLGIVIIESPIDIDILPTAKRNCRKCDMATTHVYYSMQTRSSDEPETTFYRCKKCGTTERENI